MSTVTVASVPNAKEKCPSHVELSLGVLYAHRTLVNWSTQLPLCSPILVFSPCLIVLLKASTKLLDSVLISVEKALCIPNRSQNCLEFLQSNCVPWSVIIFYGIPNFEIMFFHKKISIFCLVMCAGGSASTLLVK